MARKTIRRIFLGCFLALLCGIILWNISKNKNQGDARPGLIKAPARSGMSAKGLYFEKHREGAKILSAKIGSLGTRKQKVGFFSVNPFETLEINSIQVNFYEPDLKKRKRKFAEKTDLDGEDSAGLEIIALIKDRVPVPNSRILTGVLFRDITINFYKNSSLLSRIHSKYAGIDFKSSDIIFWGEVVLSSAKDTLRCDRIRWIKETRRFRTEKKFFLTRNGESSEGYHLTTDRLLKDISRKAEPK